MRRSSLVTVVLILVISMVVLLVTSGNPVSVGGQSSCRVGQRYEPCTGVTGYDDGQCTCYAAKRALESGVWEWFPSDLGNAYQWDNIAQDPQHGLSVGTIPYPNSVVVWEANVPGVSYDYGHVGYVESVEGTARHSFTVSHMNFCGADSTTSGTGCTNCVAHSSFNAADFREGEIHFIYPPFNTPVQLWPYDGKRIEFREQIRLQWYGDFDEYVVWYSLVYPDGTGGGGLLGPVRTEYAVLSLDRPAYIGWLVLGYDDDGGRSGVESNDGVMQWFYAGPCPACGTQANTVVNGILQQCGAGTIGDPCSAEANPVPPPTSTPFPTPTNVPAPTVEPTGAIPPSYGKLVQTTDLHFSPNNPLVGEQVHFWFGLKNTGGEVVTYTEVGAYGYLQPCGSSSCSWNANNDGHYALNPDEETTINGYRRFAKAGTAVVDGIHYQLLSDTEPRSYYEVDHDGYASLGMEISVSEPTATITPKPLATPTPSWFTPTVVYTPAPTATPGGGLATPTLVGITPTPCTSLLAMGDFDCDCQITIAEVQQVANRWRCGFGDVCYGGMYDLNRDGIINTVDITIVTAHLGESCGD